MRPGNLPSGLDGSFATVPTCGGTAGVTPVTDSEGSAGCDEQSYSQSLGTWRFHALGWFTFPKMPAIVVLQYLFIWPLRASFQMALGLLNLYESTGGNYQGCRVVGNECRVGRKCLPSVWSFSKRIWVWPLGFQTEVSIGGQTLANRRVGLYARAYLFIISLPSEKLLHLCVRVTVRGV